MPRRTATLLASTVTLLAILIAGVFIPVPYAEMSPGPTVNTLGAHDGEPVLHIEDRKTYPTSGHLNMTTVRVTGAEYKMNLVEAVYGWLSPDDAVVPHESLYPDDATAEEVDQQNAEQFSASQESAKVAALEELGISFTTRVIVASVLAGGAAQGTLHAGDVIKAVDGRPVTAPGDVVELVTGHKPGEKVTFRVVPADRAAKAEKAGDDPRKLPGKDLTVTAGESDREPGKAMVGITAGTAHTFPFAIDIKLADVGGPSAGLMFALGIVDKLTKGDLTGGEFVAGTGTINPDGRVGPIGGIHMKTIGARDQGAEYFLTPAQNCPTAARDVPDGLTLVKVGEMDDAMAALKHIREGSVDRLEECEG
ncbi:PDZ domain-containing protein [Streptomyces sp. MAR4 CNX-425]|uniref:YlbL family protein n=1 Tax=Streptomyces sp. MAR4 CNX-425 TaxID=3406343 RepID=UPI003B50908F